MSTTMVTPLQHTEETRLALEARAEFARALAPLAEQIDSAFAKAFTAVAENPALADRKNWIQVREATKAFDRNRSLLQAAFQRHWHQALNAGATPSRAIDLDEGFTLVDDQVVENQVAAARLGNAIADATEAQWKDLKRQICALEQRSGDLPPGDPLRPDVFGLALLEAWSESGLTLPMWELMRAEVQPILTAAFSDACQRAGAVVAGVKVSRQSTIVKSDSKLVPADQSPTATGPDWSRSSQLSGFARAEQETRMVTAAAPPNLVRMQGQKVLNQLQGFLSAQVGDFPTGAGGHPRPPGTGAAPQIMPGAMPPGGAPPMWGPAGGGGRGGAGYGAPAHGQATPPGASGHAGAGGAHLSPALAERLAQPDSGFAPTQVLGPDAQTIVYNAADVTQVAQKLQERTRELKAKAQKPDEKATIEVVNLMFQAILAEERIPADMRVWFARLQMPVLRLALAEPEFFASIEHPARRLIDRMGACVLGFDTAQVAERPLAIEIKRVVQVIEQYPETGRRVYELVLKEFEKFLRRSLTQDGAARQAATIAQRIEQKEALTVQYTIELRRMLSSLRVTDGIRDFLYRVWAEVLALATVRKGPKDEETLRLKQTAADLIWATSSKRGRNERNQTLKQITPLFNALRGGMTTLGLPPELQEKHLSTVNDAIMQAFVARDEALPPDKLKELSASLAQLEDIVIDDPAGEVMLDPAIIELMFGERDTAIDVIAEGGSDPTDAIVRWANDLGLGLWFQLDYQHSQQQVQYLWRSAHGQLHLFAAGGEKNYLIQTKRLAAYLQAGLLTPLEDEPLTVRATRDALTRLRADPPALLR